MLPFLTLSDAAARDAAHDMRVAMRLPMLRRHRTSYRCGDPHNTCPTIRKSGTTSALLRRDGVMKPFGGFPRYSGVSLTILVRMCEKSYMKLFDDAKQMGVPCETAWRWSRDGKI
jgi:hypothetical protein